MGHIRGGLAMAGVLACMLFAAVSGSSPAAATEVSAARMFMAGMAPGILMGVF